MKKYKKPGLGYLRVADTPSWHMVENNKGIQKKRMLYGMDTMSKKTKYRRTAGAVDYMKRQVSSDIKES